MNVQDVIDRAEADATFRQQLIANPAAAVRAAGLSLDAGTELVVLEDDASTVHLVITSDTSGDEELMPEALQVLSKARSDAAFKGKLLRDPWGAVKEATGVALPASINLVVAEDSDKLKHIVLPAQESAEGELSDLELEQVAGGRRRRRRRRSSGGGGGTMRSCSAGTLCLDL